MFSRVELKRIERVDKEKFVKMWNLYSYDFSIYNHEDLTNDVDYDFYYHNAYFDNDDKMLFFIMVDGKYAGFVSISNVCYALTRPEDRAIVDFFIMNKFRKGGIGSIAAFKLFDMFKTNWEVAQYNNNEVSKVFWEKVVAKYTGNRFELRKIYTNETTLQALVFSNAENYDQEIISDNAAENYVVKVHKNAEPETIERAIELLNSWSDEYDSSIRYIIRKDLMYQEMLSLENDDGILALISYTCLDGNICITHLCVDKRVTGQGYGRKIMHAFTSHAKRCGFDIILVHLPTFHTEDYIKPFLMRLGYSDGETFNQNSDILVIRV